MPPSASRSPPTSSGSRPMTPTSVTCSTARCASSPRRSRTATPTGSEWVPPPDLRLRPARKICARCVEPAPARSRTKQRADHPVRPEPKGPADMITQTGTSAVPAGAKDCTPAARVTKSLLGYGVLAGVVFETSVLAQGLTRRGFSIFHDDASLLANGPLGWIQVATFLVAGAMTVAAAVGA